MPRIRFFGPAADAAGVREADVTGATVEECLDDAVARFGQGLAEQLSVCRIVCGEGTVPRDHEVSPADELVVLPPVGGG